MILLLALCLTVFTPIALVQGEEFSPLTSFPTLNKGLYYNFTKTIISGGKTTLITEYREIVGSPNRLNPSYDPVSKAFKFCIKQIRMKYENEKLVERYESPTVQEGYDYVISQINLEYCIGSWHYRVPNVEVSIQATLVKTLFSGYYGGKMDTKETLFSYKGQNYPAFNVSYSVGNKVGYRIISKDVGLLLTMRETGSIITEGLTDTNAFSVLKPPTNGNGGSIPEFPLIAGLVFAVGMMIVYFFKRYFLNEEVNLNE